MPKRPAVAAAVAAAVGTNVWKREVTLPPDRFADATSLEAARDIFESDPQLRILFENGAGGEPGLPYARFEGAFDAWPVPGTEARAWYFDQDGALVDGAPAETTNDEYTYDPSRAEVTTLPGDDDSVDVAAVTAMELAPAGRRERARLRERAARAGHGDGRYGQRRSLDAVRRR